MTVWYFKNQSNSTFRSELSDFAYADTGAITKIFLADKFNNSVLLERTTNGWTANGKPAVTTAVNFLLDAVKNVEVRHPVAKAAYNNIMKQIAATGVKVELYTRAKKVKTFYVGHETQDQMGTFMYLEGSSSPFAVHVPGFNGILNIRFNTVESNWLAKNIFRYRPEEIRSVVIENFLDADESFEIKNEGGHFVMTEFPGGKQIDMVPEEKLLTYIDEFRDFNYERKAGELQKNVMDSIKQVGPFMGITVETTDNSRRAIKLYRKPRQLSEDDQWLKESNPAWRPYDQDRLYFEMDADSGFYIGQYFSFRRLIKVPSNFKVAGK